ncbi:MAG: hypothetical protein QXP84_07500 [Candidatus Korarchaeum sp.]
MKEEYRRRVTKANNSYYVNIPRDIVIRTGIEEAMQKGHEVVVIIKPGVRENQFLIEVKI